jgi:hypothetical protein
VVVNHREHAYRSARNVYTAEHYHHVHAYSEYRQFYAGAQYIYRAGNCSKGRIDSAYDYNHRDNGKK